MMFTRRMHRCAALAIAITLALPSVAAAGTPQVVRNAACGANNEKDDSTDASTSTRTDDGGGTRGNPCGNAGELGGFVRAADALVTPAVIAVAAICPIACIVGAVSTMFGSRRGVVIIGSSLGTLVFVVCVKGVVL